ncbi:MAG: NAD-dependent DNA ligase LigA [Lachnospiraceae bacterium]|nr:NAD-dependent DNA ligase LigA [Lachnospiraceae bacterium]
MNDSKTNRMKELVDILNKASEAYYAKDTEIMSNYEYDKLYDELVELEKETGITMSGSPTVNVGYAAVAELPKESHASPMLSLDKTKSREDLRAWLNGHEGILSWKLDGLTIVLTYNNGKLEKAVTRGNGEIGEVITPNAKVFKNIPLEIGFKGELVLRGEAVISYSDFEKINAQIDSETEKYKNPRNLCSGSVRQLNNEITAKRNVRFVAFNLVSAVENGVDYDMNNSRSKSFDFLEEQGFEVVQRKMVSEDNILDAIEYFAKAIENYDIPSDGLVLTYEDIAYGASLGRTAKFPRHSIAFKWADETAETILREIEWSASRTGLINPVAIFDPVELEGTTVTRASVHNVSIVRELKLGIGDRIRVYKANMIIPQISENLTCSGNVVIPDVCPVCGKETKIKAVNEAQTLNCINDECPAKQIKSFAQFVSREAMNIDGLSEATLEKLIDCGFIHEYSDLYKLERFKDRIVRFEGFGEKSYENLISAIDASRKTTLPRVIFGLGIAGIGSANAKLISKAYDYDIEKIKTADASELAQIDKIGDVMAANIVSYFADTSNTDKLDRLMECLEVEKPVVTSDSKKLDGLIFVVTGSLHGFASRNDLKELIESKGGKVTGSVTGKTTCLINNDNTSSSTKNKTAQSLGVPVITEDEFVEKYLNN